MRENIALALQARRGWARPISRSEQDRLADDYIKALDIRTSDREKPIKLLSGGNQQKAIIVRWLAQASDILVFVEPTRGIDIAAKAAIYETMRGFADSGRGIVVVSSDMPELIGIADRILVMHQGRLSGELPRGASEEDVMHLALGLADAPQGEARA